MFVVGFVTFGVANNVAETANLVTHTYQVELALTGIFENLAVMESSQRDFLFTGRPSDLEFHDQAQTLLRRQMEALPSLLNDNPNQLQRQRQKELKQRVDERIALLEEGIATKRTGSNQAVLDHVHSGKGKQAMDAVRSKLEEMMREEERLLAVRNTNTDQAEMWLRGITVGGFLIALVVGVWTLFAINRNVIHPIHHITNGLASSAMEIAATVEQQDRIAAQQAASVNETSTTMEELGTSFHATSNQAEAASGDSRQSLTLVENGNSAVEQAYEAMASLKEKVDVIADHILGLSEQTSQIGIVTTLVGDLASQTNMLALNAAVEAARAGEHGKGFGIVATEIRKLADESKRSAERIHGFVADIQRATNSTVMATEEGTKTVDRGLFLAQSTGETFSHLADSSRNLSQSVQQINLNVKQQTSAVLQVVEAMNSLNAGSRETAAAVAQTKVTVDMLNESAQRLKSIV
jgi:methyl-accepting chemotaxis protein